MIYCENCGAPIEDNEAIFCPECGNPVHRTELKNVTQMQQPVVTNTDYAQPNYPQYVEYRNNAPAEQPAAQPQIPPEYEPMGAWAFFWCGVLFSIPIVGFIFMIVFSCSRANLCRRNYARSFFIPYVIVAIVLVIVLVAAGGFAGIASRW